MQESQKLTPKYWIGHDSRTDSVMLHTASHCRSDVEEHLRLDLGDDWMDDPQIEIKLFEINFVHNPIISTHHINKIESC